MGVATFLITLHFNHIYGVCRKSKVSFNTFFNNTVPQSFELAIQDSRPSLYITKKLYQFVYFWSILEVYRKCWLLYLN